MMGRVLMAFAALSILALGGCRSTPVTYYTLTPASRSENTADGNRPSLNAMLVLRSLPAGIDTTQILIRSGDARFHVEEGGRWIAPLGDELRGALVDALRHRYRIVVVDGVRQTEAPVPRIDVTVRRFDFEGTTVTLTADWTLSNSGRGPSASLSCQAEFTETSTATVEGAVLAGQAAVVKLAAALSAAVGASSSGAMPRC